MTNLLDIRHVSCDLGDSFALHDVNLAVAPGEIVGFVGANGAGKTTTIRVALGLQHIGAGEVELLGEPFGADVSDQVQRVVRSRIGVVLDTCPFPSELRICQVVTCLKPAFPQWDDSLFDGLIAQFAISPKTKVKELSRGMGMKLQIAVALSHGADLLLLDEATAGLDPLARDEILEMLQEFVGDGERGVLLSSHITSDLERAADRVVGIDAGRIIFDVPREAITDTAGIAHCAADQVAEILECVSDARAVKREFSCDVLVPNRFEFSQAFPEVACDRANVGDYLHFMLKGGR
ncbi:ABC transporter ATP-binding protein [uncultured Senegalimassilia sp.]|uniref:ABC transporter ATP-binding protein n=1 Tax=uncultured Senegalimassilia sp. TaxID=1714350 RepID=UPI0025D9BD5C|nr:ABC transporter ATP-binding protein [uncultured Senegalimassilia sp.]